MKLADYRKQRSLTLAELAGQVGVSEVAMSRYENGHRIPGRDVMARIVAVTDGAVQPNDFYPSPATQESAA